MQHFTYISHFVLALHQLTYGMRYIKSDFSFKSAALKINSEFTPPPVADSNRYFCCIIIILS
jgi:hypothetical protein